MALTLRRNASWNITGRGVYAASQWFTLLVIARMGGPDGVGRFAFALAVTAPIMLLCNLALRHIQATDAEQIYDYDDYVSVRASTTLLALMVIAAIAAIGDYSAETAKVIGLVGLAKAFESMSDMVYGLEQVHRRLDLTARSLMVRGFAGIVATAGGYWFTGRLVGAVAAMTVAWAAVYLVLDRASQRMLLAERGPDDASVSRTRAATPVLVRRLRLVRLSLPMGVVALLTSFNINVPRYFIEAWLGETALGNFAAMAYFVVVGSFIVNGLGQAALVDLSAARAGGTRGAFYRLLGRMVAVSLALGAAGVALSGLFGRELLTLFYGPAFASDATVFVWVMTAGALSYVASALFYGVTARRIFSGQVVLCVLVAATNVVACSYWTAQYGILGAVWAWIISLVVQILLSTLLIVRAGPPGGELAPGRAIASEGS